MLFWRQLWKRIHTGSFKSLNSMTRNDTATTEHVFIPLWKRFGFFSIHFSLLYFYSYNFWNSGICRRILWFLFVGLRSLCCAVSISLGFVLGVSLLKHYTQAMAMVLKF
jgi:hypothetical protein